MWHAELKRIVFFGEALSLHCLAPRLQEKKTSCHQCNICVFALKTEHLRVYSPVE